MKTEEYKNWLDKKEKLNNKVISTEKILIEISGKHPSGLTPDKIKFSPSFKNAKANFNKAFKELREFNKKAPKEYLKKNNFRYKTNSLGDKLCSK